MSHEHNTLAIPKRMSLASWAIQGVDVSALNDTAIPDLSSACTCSRRPTKNDEVMIVKSSSADHTKILSGFGFLGSAQHVAGNSRQNISCHSSFFPLTVTRELYKILVIPEGVSLSSCAIISAELSALKLERYNHFDTSE